MDCVVCGLPITPGEGASELSTGTAEISKKSGRVILQPYSEDQFHGECFPDYLSSQINEEVWDAVTEKLRPILRKDLLIELYDEIRQEVREEVEEEIGRCCVLCGEELEDAREEINAPDLPKPRAGIAAVPMPTAPQYPPINPTRG